jgi:microcin C transport system substrate-binding protein
VVVRTTLAALCRGKARLTLPRPSFSLGAIIRYLSLPVLALAPAGSAALQQPSDEQPNVSHGYAVFGDLKYGDDFSHFDYVNPAAPKGGQYRFAQTGSFDNLNMVSLLGTAPRALLPVYDTLLQQSLDEPASYYCLLCRTITLPDDRSWVEFELEPAARWHDGRPVTADDVIFTFEVAKGLTTPLFSRVPQITERLEKLGPRRVRFHFTMSDNPTLPIVVGMMPIQPKHVYEDRDLTRPSLEKPIGSGPYRMGRVSPGRFLVLERVPDYWAANKPINVGRWNFDQMRLSFYRDLSLQNDAFLAGLHDLRLEMDAKNMRQQERSAAYRSGEIKRQVLPYDNGTFYNSIAFNTRRPLLADRALRQAMVLAYDFEWTRRIILGGDFGRTDSYFPNSDFEARGLPGEGELAILAPFRASLLEEVFTREPWLPEGGDRKRMRANLLLARELLQSAGYRLRGGKLIDPATGQPIRLELLAYSPLLYTNVAQFIDSMERLGIEVGFRSADAAQMTLLMGNYDYDLLLHRPTYIPTAAPGVGLALQWGSAAADQPNQLNLAGVKHPAIDAALTRLIEATDRETVVSSVRAIDRIARWEFYSIPLHHSYPTPVGELPIAYWDKFGRPAREPTFNFPYMTLESWWYDPAKAAELEHGTH